MIMEPNSKFTDGRVPRVREKKRKLMTIAPKPLVAIICLLLGYYIGIQHAMIVSHNQSSSVETGMASFLGNESSKASKESKGMPTTEDPAVFKLNQHVQLSEDPLSYKKIVYPLVEKLVREGSVSKCPQEDVEPYFDILRNIQQNPDFYEDTPHAKNTTQTCPVVFLFYFEGGTVLAENFFNFYSNIKTKRCLNFIVNKRWRDSNETQMIVEKHGYTIVGKSYPKQDKTISMSLDVIKDQYGEDVLVSVNDLDHLMVWFDHQKQPRRYSSYTDMVRLYVFELLTTYGCSNQNVNEKYVVPCTCLMENNEKYVSLLDDGILWSEYGVNNRFHPTANFYLDRSKENKAEKRDSEYAYSIGTVFANLRKYERDIITHHKIGWRSKKIFSRARLCGVIHARSDNMIQSLAKYQHFLHESRHNVFRSSKATIADAMGCSIVDTHGILANEKTCRTVKELSNILSIGHQKLACLNAGYSEEHCMSDMSCCMTY